MAKELICGCGSTEFRRELERKDLHVAEIYWNKKEKCFEVSPGEFIENIEPDDARCELVCDQCGEVIEEGPNGEIITFD